MLTENALRRSAAEAWAQGLGGHLVTVNDAAEQAWLERAVLRGEVWIGLTDEAVEGTWVWMSGEAVTYTNWASGQPATRRRTTSPGSGRATGSGTTGTPAGTGSGLAELAAATTGEGGPGPWSQYLLDVTVSDLVPPSVVGVDGLPGDGQTSDKPIDSFSVTFSEDLLAAPVNTVNPLAPAVRRAAPTS